MNWPYLKRIGGIVLMIVFLAGLLFVSTLYPKVLNTNYNANYGFGPEWSCQGGHVCIRRP